MRTELDLYNYCHVQGCCSPTVEIMALIVPIVHSTLFASGCLGVHQIGEQPTLFWNSQVNSAVKFPALSLVTLVGKPVNCHSDNIASQQLLAVKLRTATAWGNLHSDSLLYSPSAAVEIVYVDYPEVDVIRDWSATMRHPWVVTSLAR